MTLRKFISLSCILLNIHGSFSCGPKNKAISCNDIDDMAELMDTFERTLMKTHSDCKEEKLNLVYNKISLIILEDVNPQTSEDLLHMLLLEMAQMRETTSKSALEFEPAMSMHDELYKIDSEIRKLMHKSKNILFLEQPKNGTNTKPNASELRNVSLSCEKISQMEKLLIDGSKQFSESEITCKDKEKEKLFLRTKGKFLLNNTDLKGSRRLEKYMDKIRLLPIPKTFDKMATSLKILEKLRLNIKMHIAHIDDIVSKKICDNNFVQIFKRKFCKKNMIYNLKGPLISSVTDEISWFSKEGFKMFRRNFPKILMDTRLKQGNFISLPLGLDTVQTTRARNQIQYCSNIGRRARLFLDYAKTTGIHIQLRLFENTARSSNLEAIIENPEEISDCLQSVMEKIDNSSALHSISLFTNQDILMHPAYDKRKNPFLNSKIGVCEGRMGDKRLHSETEHDPTVVTQTPLISNASMTTVIYDQQLLGHLLTSVIALAETASLASSHHKTDIGIGRIIFENVSEKVLDNDSICKTTEHLDFFTLIESPESCWFMNEQNLPKCLQKPVMIVKPGSMIEVPKYSLTKWYMEYIQ